MIIHIIGPNGSGKTAIADAIRERTNGIHLNSKNILKTINNDILQNIDNEVENSRRIGELAIFLENAQQAPIVVDIECYTKKSRDALGDADVVIWVDTVTDDPNWEIPEKYDHKIKYTGDAHEDAVATRAITVIRKFGMLDWKEDAILFLGRHQDWNKKDFDLLNKLKNKGKQIIIGIKHTVGMSKNDKLHFHEIKNMINSGNTEFNIIKVPNITNIVYNSNSDYRVLNIEMDNENV